MAVRGELQIAQAYKLARSPDLIGLGVTGARVLAAEVKGITSLNPQAETGFRWRRAKVSRLRNGYVVHAPLRGRIEPNLWIGRVILFRLLVDATQEAGHASCSMSSPALFRLPGEDMLWDQASALGTAFLRDRTKMVESLYGDAIVHMAIPGRIPDRSELDAGATVHGDALLLTCHDGFDRRPPQEALEGDFYYMRTLPQQSSCASVQTFRATNATEDLNRRGFLAGALISAAISFFLLAISGRGLRTRAA